MAGSGTAHLRPASADAVLRALEVVVEFPIGRTGLIVSAVAGISFDVLRGETVGLVGESGCGKTSLARAVMQLPPPSAGSVWFDGRDLTAMDAKARRAARTGMQMIFQDPIAALNPRRSLRDAVLEPLAIWKRGDETAQSAVVDRLLEEVGIDPLRAAESRPHEFSGGQCQRVAIARALVLEPSLVICDEPVSSLDVSVQAQVLNLLEDLKASHGLSLVFIAHDLAVVKNVSDRVVVMYLGKVCEVAASELLYTEPAHPYTRVLIDSIPVADPTVPPVPPAVGGEPPSAVFAKDAAPPGCRFAPRCPRATTVCVEVEPQLAPVHRPGIGAVLDHFVACHHPLTDGTDGMTPH
jgi:peptide/nickel transport system ATP-binding protein